MFHRSHRPLNLIHSLILVGDHLNLLSFRDLTYPMIFVAMLHWAVLPQSLYVFLLTVTST
jgi:hypothetical protein